jgi:hypothetical protein
LGVTGDAEAGPVTATGTGYVVLAAGSSLNGSNGDTVSVSSTTTGTDLFAAGPGTDDVGALSVGSGGSVRLGGITGETQPVANLDVKGSVAFAGSSSVFSDIIESGGCPANADIGKTFPLLSTPGTISGSFDQAGNGEVINIGFGLSCTTGMQMHYTAHEVSGTIVNSGGAIPTVTVSASPNPATAGQPVTYSATVSGSSGTPTGSVTFAPQAGGTLCTAHLSNGSGSCTSSAAAVGRDEINVSYSGDSTYRLSATGLIFTVNSPTPTPPPATPHGYWLVGSDGGIFTFGSSQFYGSTGSLTLQRPVVGISPTADRNGYWMVASDGGVFAYGDAGFVGSIPGVGLRPAGSGLPNSLNAPIVGIVPSRDGGGYFMVASDGGVFAFGDAYFAGSCPGIGGCSGAAVDVMPDSTGNGYWIVTSTGNVYGFGDAAFYGSPGHGTVTSAVATPDGKGYWVLLSDGEIFAYGSAADLGSPPSGSFNAFDPANAIFATSDGGGYWVSSAAGAVYNFGDAPNDGSMAGTHLNGPIIAGNGS